LDLLLDVSELIGREGRSQLNEGKNRVGGTHLLELKEHSSLITFRLDSAQLLGDDIKSLNDFLSLLNTDDEGSSV